MQTIHIRAALYITILLPVICRAETAEEIYQKGLSELRNDHVAEAAKTFALASSLAESVGDEAKAVEINSALYWCRKKFTLADTQSVNADADTAKRIEAIVSKKIEPSNAQQWLDRANAYSKVQSDPLLVAIRYFEVGDRFKDTDAGHAAIDLSLKAMQRIGERANLEEYKPGATDGKIYLQSDPPGAAIILSVGETKQDSGKKTPCVVSLPKGSQTVYLELKGMKPEAITVRVGDGIEKIPVVKLSHTTVPVDVIFEEGWSVFLDGKTANASNGDRAVTPCTINTVPGVHLIAVARTGFWDIAQRVTVVGPAQIDIKGIKSKGASTLLGSAQTASVSGGPVINLLNLVDPTKDTIAGTWRFNGKTLAVDAADSSRIEVPYSPPSEYDLKVTFSRTQGEDMLCVIMVHGDKQF